YVPHLGSKCKPVGRSFRRFRGLPMRSILFLLGKFRENLLNALYSFESTFRYLERRPSVLAAEALATAPNGAVPLMRPAVEDPALSVADRTIHGCVLQVGKSNSR